MSTPVIFSPGTALTLANIRVPQGTSLLDLAGLAAGATDKIVYLRDGGGLFFADNLEDVLSGDKYIVIDRKLAVASPQYIVLIMSVPVVGAQPAEGEDDDDQKVITYHFFAPDKVEAWFAANNFNAYRLGWRGKETICHSLVPAPLRGGMRF